VANKGPVEELRFGAKSVSRIMRLGALALAGTLVGTMPAAWAETRVERSDPTMTPGENNGQTGYWIEYEEYTFESFTGAIREAAGGTLTNDQIAALADYLRRIGKTPSQVNLAAVVKRWAETGGRIDVVAYYRPYRSRWLDALSRNSFEEAGGRRDSWFQAVNEDQVLKAVEGVGWSNVYNYVRDKTTADWQNHGLLFIDPLTNAIVGHQYVENSYDMRNVVGNLLNQNARVNLNTGTFDIRLAATSALSSPIVLDLAGLGHPDLLAGPVWKVQPGRKIATSAVRKFDLDGTGGYVWEWVGPRSGILVWDEEGNGRITSGAQLFGSISFGKKWKDGYDALATLDKNGDGQITAAEFDKLGVWVDANSDGVSDKGEVKPLTEWGIESLNVKAQRDAAGNAWAPQGFVRKMPDGTRKTLATWDWMSMGVAKADNGVYVWVGKYGQKELGGYLNLEEDNGQVRGMAVPTVGVQPLPNGLLAAFPIQGKRSGEKFTWTVPHDKGTVTSEVTLDEGGKHLYGKTRVKSPTENFEYKWQAELISGTPLGAAGKAPRGAR
jgi:hypothetical protein